MVLVLIAEIVSALVALALVVAIFVQFVKSIREKQNTAASDRSRKRHQKLAMILVAAVIIHGICAMVYASGANPLAYVFGWLAMVALIASGACMIPVIRVKLAHASVWHNGLFIAAIVFIIAHAVAGRL